MKVNWSSVDSGTWIAQIDGVDVVWQDPVLCIPLKEGDGKPIHLGRPKGIADASCMAIKGVKKYLGQKRIEVVCFAPGAVRLVKVFVFTLGFVFGALLTYLLV